MDQRDPIIVSAVRTPIGDFGGALRDVSHTKLASLVMGELCRRANFPKEVVEDVYWGIVMPRSDENGLARAAVLVCTEKHWRCIVRDPQDPPCAGLAFEEEQYVLRDQCRRPNGA